MSSESFQIFEDPKDDPKVVDQKKNSSKIKSIRNGCTVCCCREIVIIILIILVTGLTAISLIYAKERNILREKIHNLTEIGNIRNEKLNQLTKDVESASTYHKIGEFGYFQKLNKNKTYAEGQKACSQNWGHIVEFSTSTSCKTNRKSKHIYVLINCENTIHKKMQKSAIVICIKNFRQA